MTEQDTSNDAGGCPVMHDRIAAAGMPVRDRWWPENIPLNVLRQNHPDANPLGADFDYAEALKGLDVEALYADLDAVFTDSKEWWPADFGHYGPFMVRLSWHAAGTYRVEDGRGGAGEGQIRFAPLNSWPDNGNLDKARRLLWPVKQKYGNQVSWADLFVLAGNRAMEHMGWPSFGFAFGRADTWTPEEGTYWGPESEWLADERYSGDRDLERPLGAVQMGLIYVNPQGPNGNPDPMASARDIRETFGRMAMNDEETAALIAGGHTFGKTHGAHPDDKQGREPEGADITEQGFGWTNGHGTGMGADALTSGLEVTWTDEPTRWTNKYLRNLYKYEWQLVESPAGAKQWEAINPDPEDMVPEAHDPSQKRAPRMLTSDLALKEDPVYREITEAWANDFDAFTNAYARAWFKLIHRDMGPKERFLGPFVPQEELIWMDPVPAVDHELIGDADISALKAAILESGASVSELVSCAWASASTYRKTDHRGGANGARIRLAPQNAWDVNVQAGVARTIGALEGVAESFGKPVSIADMIVLGGCAAIEKAAADAGVTIAVPFRPGRTDASQDQTDVESVGHLEPTFDGFRNYLGKGHDSRSEHLFVERAFLLGLTAPEMTVLTGGMRVLGTNVDGSSHGVFTDRPGVLTNDFFTNLLSMDTVWSSTSDTDDTFEGKNRVTGEGAYTATRADLIFGSNSELRNIAEVYAQADSNQKFYADFVAAWSKVMEAGRFD